MHTIRAPLFQGRVGLWILLSFYYSIVIKFFYLPIERYTNCMPRSFSIY